MKHVTRMIRLLHYRIHTTCIRSILIHSRHNATAAYIRTTPYSDKYYQPIIAEGADGFDKLVIPIDFCADNQNLVEYEDQEKLEGIVKSFHAPMETAIGYGSGVLPQDGYPVDAGTATDTDTSIDTATDTSTAIDTASTSASTTAAMGTSKSDADPKQMDFIFVVKNSASFHKENLLQNANHYSSKSLMWINYIQGKGIYFNPYASINNHLTKYGIIERKSAMMDLSEWSSLYFAGRLQKPVNFVKDDDIMLKFLNQYNLKNAMTIAIFLIESNSFTERQLYEQITNLSYLGDFRMYIGGENPHKVKNIVSKQFHHFKKLYDPILQYFIHRNYLVITDNDETNRTFKTNLNPSSKIKLISCLPLKFRTQLYSRYPESSIKDIVKDRELANNLRKLIAKTIAYSSLVQAVKGVFTAGVMKSAKYALAKRKKSASVLVAK
ncbi:hypothetical protein LELG_03680 [Lodderomyces elongisporus NRRL YB-4239]|uniref:Phosphatidate cytidylyltransferase, mitochondrial n=2 Tax=Lodderomyces elongisporus TaxID=36914 RepID=A5E243_LODEL|nr:hypothetical protein LELG_03680 [Lodderomyces elongisporus NRRL YB-4239]